MDPISHELDAAGHRGGSTQPLAEAVRLASAGIQQNLARLDEAAPLLIHQGQPPGIQAESHCPGFTRVEVDALECGQLADRGFDRWRNMGEVDLHHLITRDLSDIRQIHSHLNFLACGISSLCGADRSVLEAGIAQAKPKGINWIASEITIGTALHCVIFKWREILDTPVECNRQPPGWIRLSKQHPEKTTLPVARDVAALYERFMRNPESAELQKRLMMQGLVPAVVGVKA